LASRESMFSDIFVKLVTSFCS